MPRVPAGVIFYCKTINRSAGSLPRTEEGLEPETELKQL